MTESVQSCFELSILYISLYIFPGTIFSSSSRLVRYTDKCTIELPVSSASESVQLINLGRLNLNLLWLMYSTCTAELSLVCQSIQLG